MLELKQSIYNTELGQYEIVAFHNLSLRDYTCTYEIMGDKSISGDILSNEEIAPQDWISNCFVSYRGENWKVYKSPVRAEENSIFKFKYTCTFKPLVEQTKNIPFIDIVIGSNISSGLSDVVFYGNIIELLDRIIANTSRIGGWSYSLDESISTTDYRDISLSGVSIYEAIQSIYDVFGVKYDIIGNVINVGYETQIVDYEFAQGKGNGLYEIVKTPTDDAVLAYVRGCGSTKNMPINYYTTGRFATNPCPRYAQNLLPAIYTQGGGGMAIWERDYYQSDLQVALGNKNEQFLTFDGSDKEEIYPTIKGATYNDIRIDKINTVGDIGSDVINADGSIQDKTFEITLNPLGFDIAKIISNQGELTVSMTSGDCVGCNFKVVKINGVNTNPSKATNAFGASKLIANVTEILDGNYGAIPIASFYRYSLYGSIKINDAFLGDNSGFGFNDNNNYTDEYILYIRTYLYNNITKETVEVDVKQFTSPTYDTDLWDLSGQQYIYAKEILAEDITVGNWTLYLQPIVDITNGLSGYSQKTFSLTTIFDEDVPLIIIGDITADDGTIAPIDESVTIVVEKSLNDYNTLLPNSSLSVEQNDEFIFTNAAMPDYYVIAAEQRLGQAIQDYINKNDFEKYTFSIKLDSKIVNLSETLLSQLYIGYAIKLEQLEEALDITNISITHKDSQLFDEYEIQISPTIKRLIGNSKLNNTIKRVNSNLNSQQSAILAYTQSLYNSINLIQAKAFSAEPIQETSGNTSLDATTLGATIYSANDKTTPISGDNLVIADSADGNKAKKISWSAFKSAIKSYFDTIYSMIGHTHPQYISSESDPTVASHVKNITTTDIYNWNNTAYSSHTHSNKSILDGITDSGVGNWNTAYTAVNNATDVAIGNTIAKRNASGEIVFSKVTTTALVLNGWTMTIE